MPRRTPPLSETTLRNTTPTANGPDALFTGDVHVDLFSGPATSICGSDLWPYKEMEPVESARALITTRLASAGPSATRSAP
ncbi:MAG: hypothetical protein M3292_01725 [Actinomycetota bacterium]|nr:hypothetical protein [Actinomycetota bacterium]